MRFPDVFLDCVAFLCDRNDDQTFTYRGTALFVMIQFEDNEQLGRVYLVTARHNVFSRTDPFRDLWLRVNRKDGSSDHIRLPLNRWIVPDDPSVDVAILRFGTNQASTIKPFPADLIATKSIVADEDMGIGDDVFAVGLFTYHAGRQRNLPVVRSGIIAGMPSERLQDQRIGHEYDAYLIELRSFAGLSGSPVFVHLEWSRAQREGLSSYYLLGLIRSHWEQAGPNEYPEDESITRNLGVAVVTPAHEIQRLLDNREERAWRRDGTSQ